MKFLTQFFGRKAPSKDEVMRHFYVGDPDGSKGVHTIVLPYEDTTPSCVDGVLTDHIAELEMCLPDGSWQTLRLEYIKFNQAMGFFISIDGVESVFGEGGEVATRSQLVFGTVRHSETGVVIALCVPHYRKAE
jgi:hypothetical protein